MSSAILLVIRWADAHYIVPGATRTPCSKCGEDCVVSPSSAGFLATTTPVCTRCVVPVSNPRVLPLTGEQVKEIEAAGVHVGKA